MIRLFYLVYFVVVGVVQPYFPPYLRALGLTGREISLVLIAPSVLHLFVPFGWGWFADRTRRPDLLLRVACAGAFLGFLPLISIRTMPAIAGVYALHCAFGVAIGGLTDSLALERARQGDDYGRIRLWGSFSYAVSCGVVGWWLTLRAVRGGDVLVPTIVAAAFGASFLVAMGLRGQGGREPPHASDVRTLLADRRFRLLLVIAPLHWAALAPYHTFFGILLHDRGLSPAIVGDAFVVGVVAEVLLLYNFRRIRARASLSTLLAVAFGATVLRWTLVLVVRAPVAVVLLQALHALTFALFWACAMAWLGACVPDRLRATGQTLYTAASFGLGNIFGILGTGWLYDAAGGAQPAFLVAAAVELVPLVLVLTLGRRLDPDRTRT